MKAVVVIPVFKLKPTELEITSIKQTLKVLSLHSIAFVCPVSLDAIHYSELSGPLQAKVSFERFEDIYFDGIEGYNKLLLSEKFYMRFAEYDFMLICQPDAYVFRDELNFWCSFNYDYIGAPLIGKYSDTTFSMNMRVGNGGFSLRKISTFIAAFQYKTNLLGACEIVRRNEVLKKPWTRIPYLMLMLLGFRNTLRYFAENWKYNEDDFWSGFLDNSSFLIRKPEPLKALEFAFERFPLSCFEITKKLPFGCHAWEKYQYNSFWKSFIV